MRLRNLLFQWGFGSFSCQSRPGVEPLIRSSTCSPQISPPKKSFATKGMDEQMENHSCQYKLEISRDTASLHGPKKELQPLQECAGLYKQIQVPKSEATPTTSWDTFDRFQSKRLKIALLKTAVSRKQIATWSAPNAGGGGASWAQVEKTSESLGSFCWKILTFNAQLFHPGQLLPVWTWRIELLWLSGKVANLWEAEELICWKKRFYWQPIVPPKKYPIKSHSTLCPTFKPWQGDTNLGFPPLSDATCSAAAACGQGVTALFPMDVQPGSMARQCPGNGSNRCVWWFNTQGHPFRIDGLVLILIVFDAISNAWGQRVKTIQNCSQIKPNEHSLKAYHQNWQYVVDWLPPTKILNRFNSSGGRAGRCSNLQNSGSALFLWIYLAITGHFFHNL